MERYVLSTRYKNALLLSFRSTFALLAFYFVFFLVFFLSVIQGWLERDDRVLEFVSYIVGPLFVMCILFMASYAVVYLWHLWKSGYRKEAAVGLVTFFLLNILTGYIWFYSAELRRKAIKFGIF